MRHIKEHYFTSHPHLNKFAVIPAGPDCLADFAAPHDRATRDYSKPSPKKSRTGD